MTRVARLVVLVAALAAGCAEVEFGAPALHDSLALAWKAGTARGGQPIVDGYIYNTRGGYWASGVLLEVVGLDASGQQAWRTISWVMGDVPPSNRSYFEVRVPAPAADYRVSVMRVDWRGYGVGG